MSRWGRRGVIEVESSMASRCQRNASSPQIGSDAVALKCFRDKFEKFILLVVELPRLEGLFDTPLTVGLVAGRSALAAKGQQDPPSPRGPLCAIIREVRTALASLPTCRYREQKATSTLGISESGVMNTAFTSTLADPAQGNQDCTSRHSGCSPHRRAREGGWNVSS